MDWSTVSMKLDGAKLSQYLYLWYDLNALVSYDKIEGKKKSSEKNKMKRIKHVINSFMKFCDKDIPERPTILQEYKEWQKHVMSSSNTCAQNAFDELKGLKIDGMDKYNTIDDMTISAYITNHKKLCKIQGIEEKI